jgi:hypothetical protein
MRLNHRITTENSGRQVIRRTGGSPAETVAWCHAIFRSADGALNMLSIFVHLKILYGLPAAEVCVNVATIVLGTPAALTPSTFCEAVLFPCKLRSWSATSRRTFSRYAASDDFLSNVVEGSLMLTVKTVICFSLDRATPASLFDQCHVRA